jgi:hypothetical protein
MLAIRGEGQFGLLIVDVLGGQPACCDHAAETASRVSPATEAKQENLVALLVQVRDTGVAVLNFGSVLICPSQTPSAASIVLRTHCETV